MPQIDSACGDRVWGLPCWGCCSKWWTPACFAWGWLCCVIGDELFCVGECWGGGGICCICCICCWLCCSCCCWEEERKRDTNIILYFNMLKYLSYYGSWWDNYVYIFSELRGPTLPCEYALIINLGRRMFFCPKISKGRGLPVSGSNSED